MQRLLYSKKPSGTEGLPTPHQKSSGEFHRAGGRASSTVRLSRKGRLTPVNAPTAASPVFCPDSLSHPRNEGPCRS